jgi:3-phenylpropionate/cinnamic acid dioxygenase small subunit
MIRQRYREEFEGAGIHQVRKMIKHGNYAEDEKRRHAQLWIDEQERDEDRVYRARATEASASRRLENDGRADPLWNRDRRQHLG